MSTDRPATPQSAEHRARERVAAVGHTQVGSCRAGRRWGILAAPAGRRGRLVGRSLAGRGVGLAVVAHRASSYAGRGVR